MPSDELSYEEVITVFELKSGDEFLDYKEVAAALGELRRPDESRSERTIRRITRLAEALYDREAAGLPIDFTNQGFTDLKERVGYSASMRWVVDHTHWYLIWRKRHELKVDRLNRLIREMWVPDYEQIPRYLLTGDGELHTRMIDGIIFRWQESLTDRAIDSKVTRCWYSEDDHRWLRKEVLGSLPKLAQQRLRATYTALQLDASDYVTRAARRRTQEGIGDDERLLIHTVTEARRLNYIGDSGFAFHDFEEAVRLATDPSQLADRIGIFSDRLNKALTQWWGSNRTEQTLGTRGTK